MPIEVATYIGDLVGTNPPTSDLETQGANHLQLIKTVLQNTFGTAVHRFVGIPNLMFQNAASLTLVAANAQASIWCDTTSNTITITLPTLGAGDAGWFVDVIKVSGGINPVYVQPASGTIISGEVGGLAKIRRCIPGKRTRVLWGGSAWFAERVNPGPVGSCIDWLGGSALPFGYEWPNGQTLAGTGAQVYPEYFTVMGTLATPDIRDRAVYGLGNMGGADSGRITVAGGNWDGTSNWNSGGNQNHTLALSEAPTGQFTFNFNDPGHAHSFHFPSGNNSFWTTPSGGNTTLGGGTTSSENDAVSINPSGTGISASITDHAGGGSHTIMSPGISLAKLLIVE